MAKQLTETEQKKAASIRTVLRERASDGKIFSVTFTKRTTGEIRQMVCRLGVLTHLKGGEKPFDDAEKGVLTVFDVQKGDYRSISAEAVSKIRIGGEEWVEAGQAPASEA